MAAMNWKHFCFAALLAGAAMVKAGAPFLPVAAGVGAVVAVNLLRVRRHGTR
jgi:hypothetical protein